MTLNKELAAWYQKIIDLESATTMPEIMNQIFATYWVHDYKIFMPEHRTRWTVVVLWYGQPKTDSPVTYIDLESGVEMPL
jgi:hypothetical protein